MSFISAQKLYTIMDTRSRIGTGRRKYKLNQQTHSCSGSFSKNNKYVPNNYLHNYCLYKIFASRINQSLLIYGTSIFKKKYLIYLFQVGKLNNCKESKFCLNF
ncbi:hypothetical protein EDEG_00333 [Edhazardia aedis USNM 41457]|uniref:Uncharacterized protein n=1 Tax=Edhazardia aedis (strain USNM 41457) TaxID=1003232 RepID=J8ZQD1_EDHAE|nr:hypothetical protein EDEG_00333 [Edhazardia aedis USNM 41457]|eukprot:EJW01903.1 hypothetical protein EDEG_00333 [Edhazardia aedis USNM 41457]